MIESALKGQIGYVTLNAPEQHNALTLEAFETFGKILTDWARQDLRALILTGTGKSFCAGVNMASLKGHDWSQNPLTTLCDQLEAFPAPTIAALNGGVYGGGAELAMACDFRICSDQARLFIPPARLGIHYEPKGIARVQNRVGAQIARRLFLAVEEFQGEALLTHGFVDKLVTADQVLFEAEALAVRIASFAPLAVEGMKTTILELQNGELDEKAAAERIRICFASEDHAEGLKAQSEKRPPVFKKK